MEHLLSRSVTRCMKIILLSATLMFSTFAYAQNTLTAESPENRVAMLELYTSEGCNSCPPADKWLSALRDRSISPQKLIPLAFHVTYWDYIGWEDRFGDIQYDNRQRFLGRANRLSTIYTPQFVLAGDDFRRYSSFTDDVRSINAQDAELKLRLSVQRDEENAYIVELMADKIETEVKDVALFIAVQESALSSAVEDGENEGEVLHHDYVVRFLSSPGFISRPDRAGTISERLHMPPDWKLTDIDIVGFAQDPHSGEILQAVSLSLAPLAQR